MATNGKGEVWTAAGKSQDDFMLRDECILLDFADNVIGHDNKYNAHKWVVGQPRGMSMGPSPSLTDRWALLLTASTDPFRRLDEHVLFTHCTAWREVAARSGTQGQPRCSMPPPSWTTSSASNHPTWT